MNNNGKTIDQPVFQIQIKISERLYLKDPQSTELGQKIVSASIDIIDELGFENYNFKKLSEVIHSTEASVYRYFENKHKLFLYLFCWYWNWLSYRLTFETYKVECPRDRLLIAIDIFCHTSPPIFRLPDKNLEALHRIVISESPKAYLTKEVDSDNRAGAFLSYKRFCRQIADIVREINPQYLYPTSLISTAVESAHNQKYFSEHLPSLTEVSKGDKEGIKNFLSDMIFGVILD